jgi:hypothetical protein
MTMYSQFVLPGDGTPPVLPSTFTSLEFVPRGFNPTASDPALRTQYWADTAGTLSNGDVMVALNGLAPLQQAQIATLQTAYQAALQVPIAYMGTMFEADASSQIVVAHSMMVYAVERATPPGFYFVDVNNNQVPMTLAQLQGLGSSIAASYWTVFQKWTALKAQVLAATTLSEVQAVVWS